MQSTGRSVRHGLEGSTDLGILLSTGQIDTAYQHISSLRALSLSEFQWLLEERFLSSAAYALSSVYASRDPSSYLLMQSLPHILALCDCQVGDNPQSLDFALHFLRKVPLLSLSPQDQAAVIGAMRSALYEKVVARCGNPVKVAAEVVVVLSKLQSAAARKARSAWERFLRHYDSHRKYDRAYIKLFAGLLLTGEPLISLIMRSGIDSLQSLKGTWKYVKSQWNGPISVSLTPETALSPLFSDSKSRTISAWSFAYYLRSPKARYYYVIWVNIGCAVTMQMAMQMKAAAVVEFMNQLNQHPTDGQLELEGVDYMILFSFALSCSESLSQLFYHLFAFHSRQQPLLPDVSLMVSLCTVAFFSYYTYSSSFFHTLHGSAQLSALGTSIGFYILLMSCKVFLGRVYAALRVTKRFGMITNSLVTVVEKSQAFGLLLLLLLYSYSSQFMIYYLELENQWTTSVFASLYYCFTQVLGNLELDIDQFKESVLFAFIRIVFVTVTNVFMLNFLITILSEVYKDSRHSNQRNRARLMYRYSQQTQVTAKAATLNAAIPPFAIASFPIAAVSSISQSAGKCLADVWAKAAFAGTFLPIGLLYSLACDWVLLVPAYLLVLWRGTDEEESRWVDAERIDARVPASSWRFRVLWLFAGVPVLLSRIVKATFRCTKEAFRDRSDIPLSEFSEDEEQSTGDISPHYGSPWEPTYLRQCDRVSPSLVLKSISKACAA